MKIFAALLCVVIGVLNLSAPYFALPTHTLIYANAFLLAAGVLILFLSGGRRGRAADLGAPHLLSLRATSEQQAAQINALNNRIQQLESDVMTARRQAETAARKTPDAAAEAQVVSFLSTLQEKGRFIDFLMDDITPYDDAQVGAAARIVHQGCSQVVRDYFDIAQVTRDQEGTSVTLDKGFDAREFRLVGRVAGQPPYRGTVLHRGWRTQKVKLPRLSSDGAVHHDREVISPAEIELH